MLSDAEKQKLRQVWQRALSSSPILDQSIQVHPDGRTKTHREILERILSDAGSAEVFYKAAEKSISMGIYSDLDGYIENYEKQFQLTP